MMTYTLRLWFLIAIMALFSCARNSNVINKEKLELLSLMQSVALELDNIGFSINTADINIEVLSKEDMVMLFNSMNNVAQQETVHNTIKNPFMTYNDKQHHDARLAFYDPNSKTIFFLANINLKKGYLAHELAHAYQDQHFTFAHIWQPYHDHPSKELFNITQYMIEGYAELVRQSYEQYYAPNKHEADISSLKLGQLADDECVECFMLKSSVNLPYSLGLRFLVYQLNQGGWPLVDKMLLNLPSSTEQIIHPHKFLIDEPSDIKLPQFYDPNIDIAIKLDGKLGEGFLLSKLLSMSITVKEAFNSASGFDGDHAQILRTKDGREVFIWRIVFDREIDAQQLEGTLSRINKSYSLMRNGRVIDWIITDDDELHHKLYAFLAKNRLLLPKDKEDQESTMKQEINMRNEQGPLINPYQY